MLRADGEKRHGHGKGQGKGNEGPLMQSGRSRRHALQHSMQSSKSRRVRGVPAAAQAAVCGDHHPGVALPPREL